MTLVGGIENPGSTAVGTVTNTGGALTLNAVVLGAGGNDEKTTPNFITNGTSTLTVGVAGSGNGVLALSGNTSGTATLTAPAVAGTVGNAIVVSNSLSLPANTAVLINGQGIGRDGNGVTITTTSVGTANATLSLGASGLFLINAGSHLQFTGGKGQHIFTQSANNDIAGTFTVSASTTASVTFTTNYTSTPVVVLTPQTTGLTSWFLSAVSNSGFTVTVAPSGTYTFGYHTIGNPN